MLGTLWQACKLVERTEGTDESGELDGRNGSRALAIGG